MKYFVSLWSCQRYHELSSPASCSSHRSSKVEKKSKCALSYTHTHTHTHRLSDFPHIALIKDGSLVYLITSSSVMQACIPCGIAVRLNGIVGPIIFQLIELGGQQKQTSSE